MLCVDIDAGKVERLNRGEVPIYEPGLDEMIARCRKAGRLEFTTDAAAGVAHGLFQFIAVGTPPDEDGSADSARTCSPSRASIGEHMGEYRIIVDKSTVPVGTADDVRAEIATVLKRRGTDVEFDVVSNPEFLKEGAAIEDFMKPDRIIVGTDNPRTAELLRALYEPFNRNHERIIVMDIRSAELTKYAANAMLATKISFMNELANLAERLGADIEHVRIGIGSDPRIGYSFIYPGCGYGGSCFPKDVTALVSSAARVGYDSELLNAVEHVNERQKHVLFQKIERFFDGDLEGKVIALWGLAFKPNTDDMREASSRVLMEALWARGCRRARLRSGGRATRRHGSTANEPRPRALRARRGGARRRRCAGHRDRVARVSEPRLRRDPGRAARSGDFRRAQSLRSRAARAPRHSLLRDRPRRAAARGALKRAARE